MRVLMISRPKHPVPPQLLMPLMDAFAGWRARYRPVMQTFDFFASGGGGCGILEVPDEDTLGQLVMEYPWGPFSEVELHVLLDGDRAMSRQRAVIEQMVAGTGA